MEKELKSVEEKVLVNPFYTYVLFPLVWYSKLGIVHCTYLGVLGYNFHFCLNIFFTFTNSVDLDEMPQ